METLNQEQVLEEVLVDEWYDTEKEKPIFFFIKRCIVRPSTSRSKKRKK